MISSLNSFVETMVNSRTRSYQRFVRFKVLKQQRRLQLHHDGSTKISEGEKCLEVIPIKCFSNLKIITGDGRLELAEVLSTQLTESLSSIKSRNQDQQLMLVKSLFFLSQILQARGKTKNASKSIKQLVKERRSMLKSFPETSNVSELAEDYRCGAKIFSDLGKRTSKKWFKKCLNYSPNHIAALTEMVEIHGVTKTLLAQMETLVEKSGPVIFVNEEFVIQPEGEPEIDANRVAAAVGGEVGEKILSDIEAIKSGNMAKNARICKGSGFAETYNGLSRIFGQSVMVARDGFEPSISGL